MPMLPGGLSAEVLPLARCLLRQIIQHQSTAMICMLENLEC